MIISEHVTIQANINGFAHFSRRTQLIKSYIVFI